MSEINLLKNDISGKGSELQFSFGTEAGGKKWLYIVLGILALELLVYAGLFFYEKQVVKNQLRADEKYADINMEINSLSGELAEASEAQTRLRNLETLLDEQLFWSMVMEELENFTYTPIVYTSLNADVATSVLNLNGVSPSYTDLGKLMLGLESSPNVEKVDLMTTGASESETPGVQFAIEVTFAKKLLKDKIASE